MNTETDFQSHDGDTMRHALHSFALLGGMLVSHRRTAQNPSGDPFAQPVTSSLRDAWEPLDPES